MRCATEVCHCCSVGCTRPRRWGSSCARSPTATPAPPACGFLGRRGHRHHQGRTRRPVRDRDRGDRGAGRLGVLLPQGDRRLPPGRGAVLGHGPRGCQGTQGDRHDPGRAWVEITYPQPIWDDEQQRLISRAHIAEVSYTAFEGTRSAVTARLIVRRIPDLNKTHVDSQGELFTVWRSHAALTDSPFILIQAEAQHRGHAIIEQTFAELIDGPLAHLPSGRFNANNAWLTCIAIAHNLTRAAATLAGRRYATARAATIRRHLINLAGRIACHAGHSPFTYPSIGLGNTPGNSSSTRSTLHRPDHPQATCDDPRAQPKHPTTTHEPTGK